MKFWSILSILVITALVAGNLFPSEARAEDSLDLEVDVAASMPWDIGNIIPGDSGNKTIELCNTGNLDGMVYIWISDIVESEGINPESEKGNLDEPGELGNYLIFQVSCDGLVANFGQPAVIGRFPEKSPPSSTRFMKIPLAAGEKITPVWRWWFYDNGMPQNDAQGDALSFNINYHLTEPLPRDCVEIKSGGGGGGAPADWPFIIDIQGVNTVAKMSLIDRLINPVIAAGPEGKNKLEFEKGTEISSHTDRHLVKLVMRERIDTPSLPEGMQIVGNAYEIVGYISDSLLSPITFDPPVKLTLAYELSSLPEGAGRPFLAFFDDTETWTMIEDCTVNDDSVSVTGPIDRTATFAIFVEVKSEEPPPETTTTGTTTSITTTPVTTTSATTKPVTTSGITTPVETTSGPPASSTTVTSPAPTASTTIKQAGMEQDNQEKDAFWRTFSLSVAVAGVTAMTALGVVERLRRSGRLGGNHKDIEEDDDEDE